MTLSYIRISIGISIFAGLLFCGWWTLESISEDIRAQISTHDSHETSNIRDASDEIKGATIKEWTVPVVVYVIILLLVGAAIVDEIRRAAKLARTETNEPG